MVETAAVLRHKVPAGMLGRIIFIAIGGALMVVGAQQAIVFPYPITLNSSLMYVTIIGSLLFGIGFAWSALFALERHWTVVRGTVEIASTNPFRSWRDQYGRRDVVGFSVRKDDSGDSTSWTVMLKTDDGKRFETQDMGTEAEAERLMRQMQDAFYG